MKKEQHIERLAFSVREAAAALGVSSRTLHDFVKTGSLPHFRLGARVLIPADALRNFIEQRTQSEKQTQTRDHSTMTEDINTGGTLEENTIDFPRLPHGLSHIGELVAVIATEVERRRADSTILKTRQHRNNCNKRPLSVSDMSEKRDQEQL